MLLAPDKWPMNSNFEADILELEAKWGNAYDFRDQSIKINRNDQVR